MRTLIVSVFVTMDGVMEAPGGEPSHPYTGWVEPYFSSELYDAKQQEALDVESLLVGRVTYESLREGWSPGEGTFADKMNAMGKDVVTSSPDDLTWNAAAVEGDAIAGVRALKAGDGGPMLVIGSRTLVHALLVHELVDELRLLVFPVILGSGFRWFPESRDKFHMALTETRRFPNDVVQLTYVPAAAPAGQSDS
jgi:dihydrofolate reductase